MARNQRTYDNEYKAQAVKLAQKVGGAKAAKELGIPDGTIYCWLHKCGLFYAFQVSWKNLIIHGSVKPEHRILSGVTTKQA